MKASGPRSVTRLSHLRRGTPYVALPAPYWSVSATVARTRLLRGSRSSVTLADARPASSVTTSATGTQAPSRLRSMTTCPPTTGAPWAVTVTVTFVTSPACTAGATTVTSAGSGAAAQAGPASTPRAVDERDTEDEEPTSHGQ